SSLHFSPLPNSCALTNGRSPETPLFPYTTLFRSIEHFGLAHESGEESDGTVRKRFLDEERVREFGRRLAERGFPARLVDDRDPEDRKSTRLNSSHVKNSYADFCLKKKNWKKTGMA